MLTVPWNKNSIPECTYKPEIDVAVVLTSLQTPEMWKNSSWYLSVIKWAEKRGQTMKEKKKMLLP